MSRSEFHLGLLESPALCKHGKLIATQPKKRSRRWTCVISMDFTIGEVGTARAKSLMTGEFKNKIHTMTHVTNTSLTIVSPEGMAPDNWARIVHEYRRKLAEKLDLPITGRHSSEHRDGNVRGGRKGPSWNSPFQNASTRSSRW